MLISLLGKLMFEKISLFCGSRHTQIPVTFVLGFYISLVITRWWKQFESIPWPDSAAVWISTCIKGHDEKSRLMRRTIIRFRYIGFLPFFLYLCGLERSRSRISGKTKGVKIVICGTTIHISKNSNNNFPFSLSF